MDAVKTCAMCGTAEGSLCKLWSKATGCANRGKKLTLDDLARGAATSDTKPAVTPQLPDDNPKTKYGVAKPAMSAVPSTALLHMMKAMADGRRKYGLANWRDKPVSASTYYDAAMRHLMAFWDGEDVADDSGVKHLGHAMACLAIILDAEACGVLNDDRPTPGAFSRVLKELTDPVA